MARGGRRQGSGRKRGGDKPSVAGRQFMRSIVDDPVRREQFKAAIDAELAQGKTDAFVKAFEHGYGRPPQALVDEDGQPLALQFVLPGGVVLAPAATGLPAPAAPKRGQG